MLSSVEHEKSFIRSGPGIGHLTGLKLSLLVFLLTGRFLEVLYGELSSFTPLSWEDKQQNNPGILQSSYSHPFYYETGTAHTWTISFTKGQFISLLVSDFSLNIYKVNWSI